MRPFFDTLRDLRNGECLADLAAELARAVQAVEATGKAATLTLALKIKPFSKNLKEPAVTVDDEIKLKLPTEDKSSTIFFPLDGDLWRRQPRQDNLPGMAAVGAPPSSTTTKEEAA